LDEIKEIVSLLREVSEEIELDDGEYEYSSIEDLAAKSGSRAKLEIESSNPRIEVTINGTFAYVRSFDTSLSVFATVSRIGDVLRNSRGVWPVSFLRAHFLGIAAVGFVWNIVNVILILSRTLSSWPTGIAWGFQAAPLGLYLGAWAVQKIHPIILRPRRAETTFWERKKDDILVNIIMLILGGVIGYLVGH
jgi:hypothetical protein